jgi:AsmA protein
MHKRWVRILLAVVALFIIVVAIVPFLIDADTFRPQLQNQISSALGRKVAFGHLSFSLLKGSMEAENASIADDPAFSTSPFLQAKKISIGVETGPLIFHRQLHVTNFTIDSPAIQLIQAKDGKWNFSSIGGTSSQPSPQQSTTVPDLTVAELKIKDGVATVSSVPATAKPFVYSKVNIDVKHFSFAQSFPFQLSARLPANGTLKLEGTAGPIAQKNASATPFQATIQLKDFDPVASGVIDPSKGISMVNDVDAQLKSDGTNVSSSGKIKAQKLLLSREGTPATRPVDIDYSATHNLTTRIGQVSDIAIHTGSVAVHVNGGFRFTPEAIMLDLHVAAPNLPVDQVEQLLPVVGVHLPSGSSLRGGTLSANVAVTGPATATTISGPVEINNTLLAGFDLGSRIQGMNPFAKSGGGTQIQTVRTQVNSSPQATRFSNIYGSVPAIGTATGDGTVSPAGALNFSMVARFNTTTGVGAVANQAVSSFGGIFGKVLHTAVNKGVPLTITGTASNPSIRANIAGMLR